MNSSFDIVENANFVVIMIIVLMIAVIVEAIIIALIHKRYISFMKKLGNGNNVDELLKEYIKEVESIKKDNAEIKNYYTKLDSDIASCIQKVGLVRYNAFKDVGSDLSFAIALLDGNDNGVVFNGIYSREMSNIYAKPVENGNSKYTLSNEEIEAIDKAINSNNIYKTR